MLRPLHLLIAAFAIPIAASGQYYGDKVVAGVDFAAGKTGKATALPLQTPQHITIDPKDNLYLADQGSSIVWRVTPKGLVDARYQYCCFGALSGVATGGDGTLYILASPNLGFGNTLSIVKANSTGAASLATDLGSTYFSQTGAGGLALDAAGNIYAGLFVIGTGGRISKITPSGVVSTLATQSYNISGVAWHNGVLYFTVNGRVGSADANGNVNDLGKIANFNGQANGLAVDASGNIFVAAWSTVQELMQDGTLVRVAGSLTGQGNGQFGGNGDGGPATSAPLGHAMDVAFDSSGALYIAVSGGESDYVQPTVRKVVGGIISTVAGMVDPTVQAIELPLINPWSLAVPSADELFFIDQWYTMHHVLPDGTWNEQPTFVPPGNFPLGIVASNGAVHLLRTDGVYLVQSDGSIEKERSLGTTIVGFWSSADGLHIGGVAGDSNGTYYILGATTDSNFLNVWKASPDGSTKLWYTLPALVSSAAADIATDAAGNLYIAQETVVRKMTPAGVLTRVAGTGVAGFSGDNGPATAAQLNGASGVAIDTGGSIYIADTNNRRIRVVGPDGTIRTIHVTPSVEPFGPDKVSLDATRNVYVLETRNGLVRKLIPNPAVRIAAVRGDGQHAIAGAALPIPLAVQVTGQAGIPAEALSVAWKVTSGTATLAAGSSLTDATGTATMAVTLGSATGPVTITATADTLPPVQFTAIADPTPSAVRIVSGDNQTGALGTTLSIPLTVQVVDSKGSPVAGIAVAFTVTGGTATLSASSAVTGSDGASKVTVTFGSAAGVAVISATVVGLPAVQFHVTAAAQPAINAGSTGALAIGNVFYPVAGTAPGSALALYGTNLATATATGSGAPLPTKLASTTVTVAGVPAPLFYVSPNQINFQLPYETPVGSVAVSVVSGGLTSQPATMAVSPSAPGLVVAVINDDYAYNSSSNPAKVGSYVTIYGTGAGIVTPPVPNGRVAPNSPLSNVVANVTATINGVPAPVSFAGLTPGVVGLFQVNLQIPALPDEGTYPLQITVGGVTSNKISITVVH